MPNDNRGKVKRLNAAWGVGAAHALYSDRGNYFNLLTRFPAALFDANGYIFFAYEQEYLSSPHFDIGKRTNVKNHGVISDLPGYVRVADADSKSADEIDPAGFSANEGQRQMAMHLRRERNQALVRNKKKLAESLKCEVCGFLFGSVYGEVAADICDVHHLLPLAECDESTQTTVQDLAILCANCHRVVHLGSPIYTLDQVRTMLACKG